MQDSRAVLLSELYAEIRASLSDEEDRAARLAEIVKEQEELLAAAREWVVDARAWGFVPKSAVVAAAVMGDQYSTEKVSSFATRTSATGTGGVIGGSALVGRPVPLRHDAPAYVPSGK